MTVPEHSWAVFIQLLESQQRPQTTRSTVLLLWVLLESSPPLLLLLLWVLLLCCSPPLFILLLLLFWVLLLCLFSSSPPPPPPPLFLLLCCCPPPAPASRGVQRASSLLSPCRALSGELRISVVTFFSISAQKPVGLHGTLHPPIPPSSLPLSPTPIHVYSSHPLPPARSNSLFREASGTKGDEGGGRGRAEAGRIRTRRG